MPVLQGTVGRFHNELAGDGLLQTLLDFATSNGSQAEEIIGTGNGSQTVFNFILANGPVAHGQCRIRLKIDTTEYELWDDGEGNFTHDLLVSSTIDYSTKAIHIETALPVDDLYQMKAFYSYGSEGQDWLIMSERTTRDYNGNEVFPGEDLKEVILKNSGPSYKDYICIGFREFKYPASNLYGWNLNIYKKFNDGDYWNANKIYGLPNSYDLKTENYIGHPMVPFNNDTMYYWFVSNKRRIVGVIRIAGTVFVSFYAGFGIRFSSASKNIYPGVVIGNGNGNLPFNHTTLDFIVDPDNNNFFVINNWGQYKYTDDVIKFLPMHYFSDGGQMKNTTNGKKLLYPCEVMQITENQALLFYLDGIYVSLYFNYQSEDICQISGTDYLVTQNIFRATYKDYMAMRLD